MIGANATTSDGWGFGQNHLPYTNAVHAQTHTHIHSSLLIRPFGDPPRTRLMRYGRRSQQAMHYQWRRLAPRPLLPPPPLYMCALLDFMKFKPQKRPIPEFRDRSLNILLWALRRKKIALSRLYNQARRAFDAENPWRMRWAYDAGKGAEWVVIGSVYCRGHLPRLGVKNWLRLRTAGRAEKFVLIFMRKGVREKRGPNHSVWWGLARAVI